MAEYADYGADDMGIKLKEYCQNAGLRINMEKLEYLTVGSNRSSTTREDRKNIVSAKIHIFAGALNSVL